MNWAEKYRPYSLKEVIGNVAAKEMLYKWALGWQRGTPEKKAVVLHGRPGVGKTTSAHALAHDFNWEVVELNASDERNRDSIKKIAHTGAVNEVLSINGRFIPSSEGARRLIILDEADNLYEKAGDYGGKRAIIDAIKAAHQPIILIANDAYELMRREGTELRKLCTVIEYKNVEVTNISRLLSQVARNEGITGDPSVLQSIAAMCDGDVRSAINDLQSIAYEKKLDRRMISQIGYRDREHELFAGLRTILRSCDMRLAIREASQLDESPDRLILWIDENMPLEYRKAQDLSCAYEYLSRADVFLGRIRRRQYFGYWRYATDLMAGGVAVSKQCVYQEFSTKYSFPIWLRRMATSKGQRQLRYHVAKKLGLYLHCSSSKSFLILISLEPLFENDDTAARIAMSLNLDEHELSTLVGERAKDIYNKSTELKKNRCQAVLFDFR